MLIRLFEQLRALGYEGGYDAVRRYARGWRRDHAVAARDAFVPLSFASGEAYQFDRSHEVVVIAGATVTVKVAQVRLCHSRMLFVRAYPRESQEMVFDATSGVDMTKLWITKPARRSEPTSSIASKSSSTGAGPR